MATPSVYIGNILSLILTLPRFVDGKKIRSKFNNEKRRMEKSSFIQYVLKNFNSVDRYI